MAKNLKRFALALCVLALCVSTLGVVCFAAYAPVTATIPVEVALTGTLPEIPDTFQVELTADDPSFPMPAGAVNGVFVLDLTADELNPNGSSGKLEMTYDKHGIYTYTVKQLDLGNEDCYQDTHTYKIIAQVVNNADYTAFDLIVVVYRDDQTEKRDDILFENRYANPTQAQIAATKTMDKKAPKDGAFQFELLDAEGVLVENVVNIAGDVIFTPIEYYKSGTYTYTLREVAGKNSKIIYDKNQYTVTVEVSKDENGDYQHTVTYSLKDKVLEDIPGFVNKTKPVIPQTGDNANLPLMLGIMAVVLIAIIIIVSALKKSGKKPAAEEKKQADGPKEETAEQIVEEVTKNDLDA